MKARSRLSPSPVLIPEPPRLRNLSQSHLEVHLMPYGKKALQVLLKVVRWYAPSAWLLALALPGYLALFYILLSVSPTAFQSWLIPTSYLVPQLLFWGANYFFFSFLLRSYRRGIYVTISLQSLLFLKLQGIEIIWWLPVLFLVLFGILETIWILICKLRPVPSPTHRRRP